ncbi:stage IV sporulation protein FB [Aquibacillus halophilus]|uniref:Stage IV sporulation protein FB n=2 Tax=Aquibacillus halophilus TaxID=930132 RepID=A0A6A8DGZ8_9BACI|nr:stage IV sporulation protein FB [Aquibacillus halophilus]
MEISVIFAIVIIHEFGHYTMAKIFQWRIRRISLWVFGGVMETDEHGSKPIREELLIALAGPIQHVLIYLVLIGCSNFSLLPASVILLAFQYNTTILSFNMLPIWPLDGGKILFLMYSSIFPYKKAHEWMIISSIGCSVIAALVFLLFYPFTLSTILLVTFILWENRLEWKQRYFVFLRFLLTRHTDNVKKTKVRPIFVGADAPLMNVFSYFRRNYRHDIYIFDSKESEAATIDEQECLNAYFKFKQYQATSGEIVAIRDS